jgi:hypothetical protein
MNEHLRTLYEEEIGVLKQDLALKRSLAPQGDPGLLKEIESTEQRMAEVRGFLGLLEVLETDPPPSMPAALSAGPARSAELPGDGGPTRRS